MYWYKRSLPLGLIVFVTIQNLKHTWGVPKKANFIAS